MTNTVIQTRSISTTLKRTLFPIAQPATVPAIIQPSWQIMLRTTTLPQTGTTQSTSTGRKYLWVRRTSRRQYNLHMSRMRETISDINPMPAIAIFSSLVGIAFILSILVH